MKYPTFALITLFLTSCAGLPESDTSPTPGKTRTIRPTAGRYILTSQGSIGERSDPGSPQGISFGADGTLYVCDRDNAGIIRFDGDGRIVSRFSGFDSRTTRTFMPTDVSVSGGIEVYALDGANSRVLRFDRNLKNAYVVYTPDREGGALFGSLTGLAFDRISGDLFVTDSDNGAIVRIDMLGGNTHSSGEFGSEKTSLRNPAGLDVAPDGTLFVADTGSGAVGILQHFGSGLRFAGSDLLEAPVDVAVLADTLLAVADGGGIVVMDMNGTFEAAAGFGIERKMRPLSVACIDATVYISDGKSSAILIYRLDRIER